MKNLISINGIDFKRQKDAIDHTRKLLYSLESISEITEKHLGWDYLNALIERHPEYESKKGNGIRSIIIHRKFGNIAIDIKHIDGSRIDISWIYCVKSTHATKYQNLIQAMRLSVKPQIEKFKEDQKSNTTCCICSEPILTLKERHIDHYQPTFKELSDNFIKENNPAPTHFDDCPITNQSKFSDLDHEYSRRWQIYHEKHAQLRLTHAKCNLSRKKSEQPNLPSRDPHRRDCEYEPGYDWRTDPYYNADAIRERLKDAKSMSAYKEQP